MKSPSRFPSMVWGRLALTAACLLTVNPVIAAPLESASPRTMPFSAPLLEDETAVSAAMRALAERLLAAEVAADATESALDNRFRALFVAGRYGEALKIITRLNQLNHDPASTRSKAFNLQYEMLGEAYLGDAARPLEDRFRALFRDRFARLDDRSSALVIRAIALSDPVALKRDFERALREAGANSSLSKEKAEALLRTYQLYDSFRVLNRLSAPLIAEDDARRYHVRRDVKVRTPDGAIICALVVRPRRAGPLPALLEFTIYADALKSMSEARRSASNGYVGVEGFTRGKACSPNEPIPYEHDGADAAALIDWISKQPWNDGRVGMFGGSYNGFTQWSTAKHKPKALKAMMPSVSVAPGLDVPMDGNVFLSFTYPWTFYTTNNKSLDNDVYFDSKRWSKLNQEWYIRGSAYRDMDKIDGVPNPVFRRWLDHPTYDSYWSNMIPQGEEFTDIDFPILTTTGYYDGGQIGALHYFKAHHRNNPNAEHYFLIGPYDHWGGQRGTIDSRGVFHKSLDGLDLDAAAVIDLGELRYKWFDYVFKNAPKPALLADKVNYQIMGANLWGHAPSLAAMSDMERFYLRHSRDKEDEHDLAAAPTDTVAASLVIDFADRRDVDRVVPGGAIVAREIDSHNGIAFISGPLAEPADLSGLFRGELHFVSNKADFDLYIQLYELTPKGDYVRLSNYWMRASHAADPEVRRLLRPGVREKLSFTSGRLTSRRLQPGSRIVMVLSGIKDSGMQINYGSGGSVSDETIADAGAPLRIDWIGSSFIDLPLSYRPAR